MDAIIGKRSFTLIEILVTATIIGLLMGIGITQYTTLSKNSRDAKRKADIESIRSAIELYRADAGGSYPASITFVCPPTTSLSWGTNVYLNPIPNDQKCASGSVYSYVTASPFQTYTLRATLENGTIYSAGPYGSESVTPTPVFCIADGQPCVVGGTPCCPGFGCGLGICQ